VALIVLKISEPFQRLSLRADRPIPDFKGRYHLHVCLHFGYDGNMPFLADLLLGLLVNVAQIASDYVRTPMKPLPALLDAGL
jgi:hypothetical protein